MKIKISGKDFEKYSRLVKIMYSSKGITLDEQELEQITICLFLKYKEGLLNEKKNCK